MSIELEVFSTKGLDDDDIVLVYVLIDQKVPRENVHRFVEQHHGSSLCKALYTRGLEYVLIPKFVDLDSVKTTKAIEVEIAKDAKTYPEFDDSMKALNGEQE